MPRPTIAAALALSVVLSFLLVSPACKKDGAESGREGRAEQKTPPPVEPIPSDEPPLAPGLAIPEGPAVAAALLRERPSEEDCRAACEVILTAETGPWLEGTPEDARPGVRQVLSDLHDRHRPACVQRCRKDLTRAATECLRLTKDVAAAVDCLDRTGAKGDLDTK